VHLAYATWNPGPVYLTGGVIPTNSNGTLDLLERSLSTGSYGEAIFQSWSTQLNNSLIAFRLGVPFISNEDIKFGVELTTSVIDPRTQELINSLGSTGWINKDNSVRDTVYGNPTSALFILDVPLVAGDFKITPEISTVLFRNYNTATEKGDHEFLIGLDAGYNVSEALYLGLNGAYGTISNENSKIGGYGSVERSGAVSAIGSFANTYISSGFIFGLGSKIKAGPGTVAVDFKYGSSANVAKEYENVTSTGGGGSTATKVNFADPKPEKLSDKGDILLDASYTWNVHPKFSIRPRWRLFYSSYNSDVWAAHISSKMENRPELILTGSF